MYRGVHPSEHYPRLEHSMPIMLIELFIIVDVISVGYFTDLSNICHTFDHL